MKTYHSTIVLTKTPLKKHFRYRDMFQVFPANHLKDLPHSDLQRHYPAVLEYWVDDDEPAPVMDVFSDLKDFFEPLTRQILKQDMILSLLSCFTNHLFFRYTDLSGSWGIPVPGPDVPKEEMNKWSSQWNLTMFHAPSLAQQLKIESFTEQQYETVQLIKHFPYYQDDPNLDLDIKREITFPHTIWLDLDSYFAQDEAARKIIDTAISYSVSAVEFRQLKKTMSVVAAFTAVETMVNFEFREMVPEQCDKCGQVQFKVARKYRDYLLKYLGDSKANKKKFNDYYSFRSRIVHTGERLKTELLFTDVGQEHRDKEFITQLEIIILSKLAIVQWLLKNRKID